MNKFLLWRLLIPLLALSAISLTLATLYSGSLDYVNILLNLTTDFFMVIVTIYYVDVVVKNNEDKRWERANSSIEGRIAHQLLVIFENICNLFGAEEIVPDLGPKLLHSHVPQTVVALYFIHEMQNKPNSVYEEKFAKLSEDTKKEIYHYMDRCEPILRETLDLFGNRLRSDLLLQIIDALEVTRINYVDTGIEKYPHSVFDVLQRLAGIIENTMNEKLDDFLKPEWVMKLENKLKRN